MCPLTVRGLGFRPIPCWASILCLSCLKSKQAETVMQAAGLKAIVGPAINLSLCSSMRLPPEISAVLYACRYCEKQSSRSCLFFTSHLSQTPKCSASFSSCSKLSPRAKGSKKLRIPSQLCSTKEVKQKNNATALVYTSRTSGHFRTAKQRSFRVHSALLLPSYTSNSNERSGGDTE